MFTDGPVTPVRLEILVDLLRSCRQGIARDAVYRLLQPKPLSGDATKFEPAKQTVRAGLELLLVEEEARGVLSLTADCRKMKDAKAAILAALDDRVLSSAQVEDYFALFYSYFLGLGKQTCERAGQDHETWANQFNKDVFEDARQANRFNGTKLTGLHRWFSYTGLGWYDPAGEFQANPYDRLRRALPAVFGKQRALEADAFSERVASHCPELDGGEIFKIANPEWKDDGRTFTLGLSHALVELHLDRIIRLNCPADSTGWSIEEAEPPAGEHIKSHRVSTVELIGGD